MTETGDTGFGAVPDSPKFIESGVITQWPVLTRLPEEKKLTINDLYEVQECFDNEGGWKGYRISVKNNGKTLRPIQPYDVPIKYDENKELDKVKSFNGLQ